MMPASNRGVGGEMHFPDVCKAPAPPAPFIPVPLPNMSMNTMDAPFSFNVFVTFMPGLNMLSMATMSSGDEGGPMGGLIIPMLKGIQRVMVGNPIVFINFIPAKNLLCPSGGNTMNAPLGATLIPSITTVLFCDSQNNEHARKVEPRLERADAASTGRVDTEGLRAIAHDVNKMGGEGSSLEVHLWSDGTAHVRIKRFFTGLSSRLYTELRRLKPKGMKRLLIDLRGNPGGTVASALALADDFLERGTPIAIAHEPGSDPIIHRARQNAPYHWPLVIVIDSFTASAAELFAGSLQANGRAVIVGQPSAGKLSAQTLGVGPKGDGYYGTARSYELPRPKGEGGAPPAPSPSRVDVDIPLGEPPHSPGGRPCIKTAFASTGSLTINERGS